MEIDKRLELEVAHLNRVVIDNGPAIQNAVNAAVDSGQLPGIRPIPSGSGYAEIEKTLRNALLAKLKHEWSVQFPKHPSTTNYDFGFFIAPPVLSMDMKIPFGALQIKMDFENWGISPPKGTPENIMNSIMLNLILKSSIVATAHGFMSYDSDRYLGWVCATITGQAGASKDNVHLIGYVFAAELMGVSK